MSSSLQLYWELINNNDKHHYLMIYKNLMIDKNSFTFKFCFSCDHILHRTDRGFERTMLDGVVPCLFEWQIRVTLLFLDAERRLTVSVLEKMVVLMRHRLILGVNN